MLRNLLADFAPTGGFQRKISVSAVNVGSGELWTATEETVPFDQFHLAVLASASVPVLFPPVEFDGKLLMDGGTVYNTNVDQAVARCREITQDSDDSEITLDVLICSHEPVYGLEKE
mmetsp:Transcript_1533/g.2233  ORF Transcript_1533/g.2233 Transcript_1533/m.2233 type:complete len:117 (-) Transcript_1533:356-706(-)